MEIKRSIKINQKSAEVLEILGNREKLMKIGNFGKMNFEMEGDKMKIDSPMGKIGLTLETHSEKVVWVLTGAPFPLSICFQERQTDLDLTIDAEVNTMMKMMVEKPLNKLADKIKKSIEEKF